MPSFDALINVFSPHNGQEFARVLRPGGVALVVTPLPEHLADGAQLLGLLGIAGDKAAGVVASMGESFTPGGHPGNPRAAGALPRAGL